MTVYLEEMKQVARDNTSNCEHEKGVLMSSLFAD